MKTTYPFALVLASMALVSCGENGGASVSSADQTINATIGKVENLAFDEETSTISYSPVEGADAYHVVFSQEGNPLLDDKISETSIPVADLGLAGAIHFSVAAVVGDKEGEASTLDFSLPLTLEDVIFEAENHLYNFGTGKSNSNFRNNPLAHGGAYVGGIDDCGQGVYIDYLCPIEGVYEFELHYLAEAIPANLGVYVNNEHQADFACTENTGYGGAGDFNPATTSVQISLKEGWNTISVMKEGDESNNWGSWVEMDYFVLKGNGETYDPDRLDKYDDAPESFRLEAEMGSPRRKNPVNNVFECKNPAIKSHNGLTFSNNYLLGGLDSNYDGVEWQFNCKKPGKYEVTVGYASDMDISTASFFTTSKEVDISHSADFKRMEHSDVLLRRSAGWDKVAVAEAKATIELSLDKNFIYCINMDTSAGIFQLDYVDIRYVG